MTQALDCSIVDGAWYTKQQLARAFHRDPQWVERSIMFPADQRTKRPICRCEVCGEEFAFPDDPIVCPACQSSEIALLTGAPWKKIGGEIMFSGRQLRLWGEQHAQSRIRENWSRYLEKLEAAKRKPK